MERLRQWLDTHPIKNVLDVGCGFGNFIHLLTEAGLNEANIVGIDTSANAVAAARKHFADRKNVSFIEGDVATALLAEGSFDVVCLSNTLHHLRNPKEVFDRMRALVKPGGALLINEMVSDGLTQAQISHRKLHHFAAEIDREMGVFHAPTYTKAVLIAKLRRLTGKDPDVIWDLAFGEQPALTVEQIDQMAGTVDRLLSRMPESDAKVGLVKKGERIKRHIRRHAYDGATQVAALIVF